MAVLRKGDMPLFHKSIYKQLENLSNLLRNNRLSCGCCEDTVNGKNHINESDSSEKSKVVKSTIVLYLLLAYFFVTLFGNVFRITAEKGSLGLGTALLCLITILTFGKAVVKSFKKPIWFALLLFLIWCSFSTLFGNWKIGYFHLLHLAVYVFFAVGLSTIKFTSKKLNILFLVIIITMLVSTMLTSLDMAGVIDVPYFNDFSEGVRTADNVRIAGASGPFMGRSFMCMYLGPLLPVIVIFGLLSRQKAIQVLGFVAFVSSMIALLISFNRAAPLAAVISILLFCVLSRNSIRNKGKVLGGFTLGLLVSLIIIYICFPVQMTAIKYKVNLTLGLGKYTEKQFEKQRNADMNRIVIAKETFKTIATHPFGYGLTNIEKLLNGKNTGIHTTFIQVIWATGFFGILWIPFFVACLVYTFRKAHMSNMLHCESIKYGLWAWFLISLVHVNWATGIVWALFGVLISQFGRGNGNHTASI